jgi:hypothetical protein
MGITPALPTAEILALGTAGAFFAGLVDAVAGGGGLIQLPVLLGLLPTTPLATVFGTNKLPSFCGTGFAALRYAGRVAIPWTIVAPAAGAAFLFAYAGSRAVALLPVPVVRPLALFLLVAVTIYTWFRKDFGAVDANHPVRHRTVALALGVGALLGFYDGFFGPGTGSFLIFAFIRLFGFDFLRASASAKCVNLATNFASLLAFGFAGHLLWWLALPMAAGNVGGALIGSHLALRHGTGFVRRIFLLVSAALIVKFGYDTFFRA